MKIALFGGSRGVGYKFLLKALAENHTVNVLVRDPSKLSVPVDLAKQLTIIQGDVMDKEAVEKTITDSEVVINSLGNTSMNGPNLDICSRGSKVIIESMKNVKRTIIVTSFGCNNSWDDASFFIKPFLYLFLGKVLADKNIQEQMYFDSDLDWTIVRPGGLSDAPGTGSYRHGEHISGGNISREDVADFIIKQLNSVEYLKKTPTVVS